MKCVRQTSDLRVARQFLKGLGLLRVDSYEIEASGTWITKDGETVFISHTPMKVVRMGTRWCRLADVDGQTIEARPLQLAIPSGFIVISWDEN